MKIIELFIPNDSSADDFVSTFMNQESNEVRSIECPLGTSVTPSLLWDAFKRVRITIEEMPPKEQDY